MLSRRNSGRAFANARRILGTGVLAAVVCAVAPAAAQAAPIQCGQTIVGTEKSYVRVLDRDLNCSGDGIVVGTRVKLFLGGHTIQGNGTGVGLRFSGNSGAVFGGGAHLADFANGIVMNRSGIYVGSVNVDFPTGDGVILEPLAEATARVYLDSVTVSNAGEDGVEITGGSDLTATLSKVKVFMSAGHGMNILGSSRTTVDSSVAKQNALDGIRIHPDPGPPVKISITNTRANYNVQWGIEGIRGVDSHDNTAVGNGQLRQCFIVECN
jgi:hypothetical protein